MGFSAVFPYAVGTYVEVQENREHWMSHDADAEIGIFQYCQRTTYIASGSLAAGAVSLLVNPFFSLSVLSVVMAIWAGIRLASRKWVSGQGFGRAKPVAISLFGICLGAASAYILYSFVGLTGTEGTGSEQLDAILEVFAAGEKPRGDTNCEKAFDRIESMRNTAIKSGFKFEPIPERKRYLEECDKLSEDRQKCLYSSEMFSSRCRQFIEGADYRRFKQSVSPPRAGRPAGQVPSDEP
jgi:hypothetical protein